jgi:hypothetical protein
MWLGVVGIKEVGWMGRGSITVGGTLGGRGPKNDIASDFVRLTTSICKTGIYYGSFSRHHRAVSRIATYPSTVAKISLGVAMKGY